MATPFGSDHPSGSRNHRPSGIGHCRLRPRAPKTSRDCDTRHARAAETYRHSASSKILVGKAFPSTQNFVPMSFPSASRSRTILPAVPPPRRDARS
jgi:hypothetical protein